MNPWPRPKSHKLPRRRGGQAVLAGKRAGQARRQGDSFEASRGVEVAGAGFVDDTKETVLAR